ncbi:MAG: DegT/DnrJ/EryC1/StrS family aminotransferase [Kofleriaceae bacterium]
MQVPFFDMRAELAPVRTQIDAAIARVLDHGELIGGPAVAEFERALAVATGSTHAIGTSSGTDALLLALLALGVDSRATVVTTPFTFFATAGSAARLGARVVFADICEDSLCLDSRAALAASDATTRAIVPVHLFGCPADLAPLVDMPVLEDAAQSLGAAPVVGLAAAVSFFPTKNLGAIGDAGAVLCNDEALADRMRLLRTHGARPKYHHLAIGGNFRLDAVQAAVLSVKLAHFATNLATRRAHAARYRAAFAAASLPPELRLPTEHPQHTYHQFVIRAPKREELREALRADGIGTEVYYPEPLHLQPCFAELGYHRGAFPIAERACGEVLALPIQPCLQPDALAFVVERITAFYR